MQAGFGGQSHPAGVGVGKVGRGKVGRRTGSGWPTGWATCGIVAWRLRLLEEKVARAWHGRGIVFHNRATSVLNMALQPAEGKRKEVVQAWARRQQVPVPEVLSAVVAKYSAQVVVWKRPQAENDLPAWWWDYKCADKDRWLGPRECALLKGPVLPGTVEVFNFRVQEYPPDGLTGQKGGFAVGVAEENSEDIVAALWTPWRVDSRWRHNFGIVVDRTEAGNGRMHGKVDDLVLHEYRGGRIHADLPATGRLHVGVWFVGIVGNCSVRPG